MEDNTNKFLANDGNYYETEEEVIRINESLRNRNLSESNLLLEG